MKRITPILISALLLGGILSAQSQEAEPALSKEITATRIDVEFDDLPMKEVANYLRETFKPLNVVITKEAAAISVTMELHNVSLNQITQAIGLSSRGKLNFSYEDGDLLFIDVTDLSHAETRPIVRVFSLSKLMDGKDEKARSTQLAEVEMLIQSTLAMWADAMKESGITAKASGPKINFHQNTSSLIVISDATTMEVVTEVIDSVTGNSRSQIPSRIGTYRIPGGYQTGIVPPGMRMDPVQSDTLDNSRDRYIKTAPTGKGSSR